MTAIDVEVIDTQEAVRRVLSGLGLERICDGLDNAVALAALVRRTASLSCPCPPAVLKQRVMMGLRGLVTDKEAVGDALDDVIDAVTAYGDLLELPLTEKARLHLFLTAPSFVRTAPGTALLLGIAPDGADMVPQNIAARIVRNGHANVLTFGSEEDLPGDLRAMGLLEIPEKLWFKCPPAETSADLKMRHDAKLAGGLVGPIDELVVIDPAKPATYYKGRWVKPGKLTGRFVGRRPQAFGAPLWCYVQLEQGQPTHLLDLHSAEWRGCDQAWRLQMAIDALAGRPQRFEAELSEAGSVFLRFFSPVPSWWQRRWDVLARPIPSTGCLFAYEMSYDQYEAELGRLTTELWLAEKT